MMELVCLEDSPSHLLFFLTLSEKVLTSCCTAGYGLSHCSIVPLKMILCLVSHLYKMPALSNLVKYSPTNSLSPGYLSLTPSCLGKLEIPLEFPLLFRQIIEGFFLMLY